MIHSIPSPFASPLSTGLMCMIIDSSVVPDLITDLQERIGIRPDHCIPLFKKTVYAPLQAAGPYLLVCQGPGALADYGGELLERGEAGCIVYLPSEDDVEQAVAHCQRLLTVSTEAHAGRLMRFYDPRWLEPLIVSLSEAQRNDFLGPLKAFCWRGPRGWRLYDGALRANEEARGDHLPLHLDTPLMDLLSEHRLALFAQKLAVHYVGYFGRAQAIPITYQQLLAGQLAGFSEPMALERWLRLRLTRDQAFWQSPATTELLANDAFTPDEKLDALERA